MMGRGLSGTGCNSLSQVLSRLSFWGEVTSLSVGKYEVNGKDAIQFGLSLSEGYSLYLICDFEGVKFISDETGHNVNIGEAYWS